MMAYIQNPTQISATNKKQTSEKLTVNEMPTLAAPTWEWQKGFIQGKLWRSVGECPCSRWVILLVENSTLKVRMMCRLAMAF